MTHGTVTVDGRLHEHAKKTRICSGKQNFLILVKNCKQHPRTESLVEIIGGYCILSAGLDKWVCIQLTVEQRCLIFLFPSDVPWYYPGGIHLNKPFRGTRFVPPQSEGNSSKVFRSENSAQLWAFWSPLGTVDAFSRELWERVKVFIKGYNIPSQSWRVCHV